MVAVTHAVVTSQPPNREAAELASCITLATRDATTDEEFKRLARGVPAGSLGVRVESLPPVAPDGRAMDPDNPPPLGPPASRFATAFAEGAQRLGAVGEMSPVVESAFGYHVMRATRIVPALVLAPAELQARVREAVVERRAGEAQAEVLRRQREQVAPSVELSAVTSTGKVDVAQ
jgi:hypothetical protein